jgi:predicted acylesterase/phospholipase RssA
MLILFLRFVCAAHGEDSELAVLRSYETPLPEELFDECKIWEAARATSAATTFFDPVQIGRYGQTFVDGAIVYNNPIHLVYQEAQHLWPGREFFIVSIGTGSVPGRPFEGDLKDIINRMKEMFTETEKTNERFFHDHTNMMAEKRLFRFNVYHGLGLVGLEEWKEKATIATTTQTYLKKGETMAKMKDCLDGLKSSTIVPLEPGPVQVEGTTTSVFPF